LIIHKDIQSWKLKIKKKSLFLNSGFNYFCNLIFKRISHQSISPLFFKWFWKGFGLVLVTIFHSFVSKINAIYLNRYMAYILLIIECYMTDISVYRPIQNQSKNGSKPFRFWHGLGWQIYIKKWNPQIVKTKISKQKYLN